MVKTYEVHSEFEPSIVRKFQTNAKSKVPQDKVPVSTHGGLTPSAHSVKEQLTLLLEEYVDANLMLKAKQRIINNKILKNSTENDVISLLVNDCDDRVVRLFLEKQQERRTEKKDRLEAQLEDLKDYVSDNNDVKDVCCGFLADMTGDAKELEDTLESKIDFITAHIGKAKL